MLYRFALSVLRIANLQFSLTVDNGVSCHVTLKDFYKLSQGEKCYLTCQCLISSKKTKVTLFAKLCSTMTCLWRLEQCALCFLKGMLCNVTIFVCQIKFIKDFSLRYAQSFCNFLNN